MNINSSEIDRVFSGNFVRDFSKFLMFILLLGPQTDPKKRNIINIGTAVLELKMAKRTRFATFFYIYIVFELCEYQLE